MTGYGRQSGQVSDDRDFSADRTLRPKRRMLERGYTPTVFYGRNNNDTGGSFFSAGTALETNTSQYAALPDQALEIVAFQIAAPSSGVTLSSADGTFLTREVDYDIGFGGASYPYNILEMWWRIKPASSTTVFAATASSASRWATRSWLFTGVNMGDPLASAPDSDVAPATGGVELKERTLSVDIRTRGSLFSFATVTVTAGDPYGGPPPETLPVTRPGFQSVVESTSAANGVQFFAVALAEA